MSDESGQAERHDSFHGAISHRVLHSSTGRPPVRTPVPPYFPMYSNESGQADCRLQARPSITAEN
jgi:hypothetical protein